MPTLTRIECIPGPIGQGDLYCLDITMHDILPGILSVKLELDPHLPHVFAIAGKEFKRIVRKRRIPAGAEEFSTRIAFRISHLEHATVDPIITITASGVDGTASPYRLALVSTPNVDTQRFIRTFG